MGEGRISYPKEMREIAKRESKSLVTFEGGGVRFQGPATKEEAAEVRDLFWGWYQKRINRQAKQVGHD